MSDRIAVMSRGRVEQIGTPEEIYDRAGEHLRRRVHRLGQPAARHVVERRRPPRRRRRSTSRWAPRSTSARSADARARRRRHGDAAPRAPDARTRASRSRAGRWSATIKDVIYQGSETPPDRRPRRRHRDRRRDRARRGHRADARPGNLITLAWAPDAPFVLPGRSAIVGATSTDVDEVQATMAGELDADDDADGATTPATGGRRAATSRSTGAVPHRRRRRRRRRASARSLLSSVRSGGGGGGGAGDGGGGSAGAGLGDGADEVSVLNWTEYIDLDRGRRGRHHRPVPGRDRDRRSTTPRPSTTTTRSTARSSSPTSDAGNPTLGHRLPDVLDGGPAQDPRLARADPVQPDPQLREPRAAVPQRQPGTRAASSTCRGRPASPGSPTTSPRPAAS